VYSRAGEVPASEDEPISHTIEPELRKLGVPTRLVKGKVMLELTEGQESFPVCKQGDVLDSRQTTLLKMFGVVTSEFKIALKAHWTRSTSEVEILEKDENGMEVE
jgi:mRNA turnover protein 4